MLHASFLLQKDKHGVLHNKHAVGEGVAERVPLNKFGLSWCSAWWGVLSGTLAWDKR